MTFILYALACIAAHRIWNFESIFQGARDWLLRKQWSKAFTCQVCNAFWVCLFIGVAMPWYETAPVRLVVETLAAYALVRVALWVYRMASHAEGSLRKSVLSAPAPVKAKEASVALLDMKAFAEPPKKEGCTTCAQKREQATKESARVSPYERRVVILTTLSNFSPSYSVATCVLDQARMLANNPGWLIQIWIHENARTAELPDNLPHNVEVRQIVPQVAWKDDTIVEADKSRLASTVRNNLIKLGNATVITHDILFVSSYASFAAALHEIGDTPGFGWLHVCHSAVGPRPLAAPGTGAWARTNLPKGHRLLCLNEAEVEHMAAYYGVSTEEISTCPNARDVTAFGNFDQRAAKIVNDFGLVHADIVQIYPVSATRLESKGVAKIIQIMGWLHRNNDRVCKLVLVTAHANGAAEKAALQRYRELANEEKLPADFLAVTSEVFPDTAANGLPQAVIRDLFSVSNVFIFPTVSEASSLVLAEAALSGCLLVTNASVHTIGSSPLSVHHSISIPFGSLRSPNSPFAGVDVANRIVTTLSRSVTNASKRYALHNYSFDVTGFRLRSVVEQTPYQPLK